MSIQSKLDKLFKTSSMIPFDDNDRFIIFSDCHRGIGDQADDFMKNSNLYYRLLLYYFAAGYIYIELGDGDELWENRSLKKIQRTYPDIFFLFEKFKNKIHYFRIIGNHDRKLKYLESLILFNIKTKQKIFLIHGNQGDFFNDRGWRIGRWFCRYIWRGLQMGGIKDPTSASTNIKKHEFVENQLKKWAQDNHQTLIAGHTHSPKVEPPYYNSGSCVGESGITGLEIVNMEIELKYFEKEVKV